MSIPPTNPSESLEDFLEKLGEDVDKNILTSALLMKSTVDLAQFKDQRGEFKKWLQIFHVANRQMFKNTFLKVTTVLPWCSVQETVDVEFHRAVMALNGYEGYPLSWRSFSWSLKPMETTPVYGVFTSNPSRESLHRIIEAGTGVAMYSGTIFTDHPKVVLFWERMKQFVLVPRSDGEYVPHPYQTHGV